MSNLKESVLIKFLNKFDDKEIKPTSRQFTWSPGDSSSSVKVISDFHVIPASSTDLALTVATHEDSIGVLFIDPDQTGDLTIKINGDTNGNTVNARRGISGNITSLTVTNASASLTRYLKQFTILPNGTIDQASSVASISFGNVKGPGSAVDNSVARFDGETGKLLASSGVIIDDNNFMSGAIVIKNIRTITVDDAVDADDDIILVNCTAGDVIVTLPLAASSEGRELIFKKIDVTNSLGIIDGNGAEKVDDVSNYKLVTQYDFLRIVCNGTAWYVIGQY